MDAESYYRRGQQFRDEQNRDEALRCFRQGARLGHHEAACELSSVLEDGGTDEDRKEAVELVFAAADAGYPRALLEVARYLIRTDPTDSMQYYRRAADAGLAEAQYELAVRLLTPDSEIARAVDRFHDSQDRLSRYQDVSLSGVGPEFQEALGWLEKAGEAGHVDAQYTVGEIYSTGHGVEQDPKACRLWFTRAAEGGHPHAQYRLGLLLAMAREGGDRDMFRAAAEQGHSKAAHLLASWLAENHQPGEAAEWYRKAVDAGHQESEFELGYLLATKLEQAEVGASFIRKAAERGEVVAQRNLAAMYGMGHGVPQDHEQAAHWYRLAAERGHPEAQFRMGLYLHKGDVLEADPEGTLHWLRLAAEQNHEGALELLTELLEDVDVEEAIQWYEWMGQRGDSQAMDRLGVLYLSRGDKRAIDYFRAAAEVGNLSAQYNLGVLYYQGQLVEQDDKEALAWFKRASDAGFPKAHHNMGALLEDTDEDQARHYYRLAAEAGVPEAQARLAELEPIDPEELPIIRVCNLIMSQAIKDGSSAFKVLWGQVEFQVEGTWHPVMAPPEHVMDAIFQRLRFMADMGPDATTGTIEITMDESSCILHIEMKEGVLTAQIEYR